MDWGDEDEDNNLDFSVLDHLETSYLQQQHGSKGSAAQTAVPPVPWGAVPNQVVTDQPGNMAVPTARAPQANAVVAVVPASGEPRSRSDARQRCIPDMFAAYKTATPRSLRGVQIQYDDGDPFLWGNSPAMLDLPDQADGIAAGMRDTQQSLLSPPIPQTADAAAELSAAEGEGPDLMQPQTTTPGVLLSRRAAQHWVYPLGVPERKYQLEMIQAALLHNLLVCLPTGLGKTLIAAVVMHNFSRWFPEGKIVFVAPTKPLVNQQIRACYRVMGVSRLAVVELTGTVKKEIRARDWNLPKKRIYFCTPQTFGNDVKDGICPVSKVVCLVVDECHRATGKNDVVLAIRKLVEEGVKFRVVGLSATPGSKGEAVQEVIKNLMITQISFKSEDDLDVRPYVHHKQVELHVVHASPEVRNCREDLLRVLREIIIQLQKHKAYYGNSDPEQCIQFSFLEAQRRFGNGHSAEGGLRSSGLVHTLFKHGMVLSNLREQLDNYGIDTALAYLNTRVAELRGLQTDQTYQQFFNRLTSLVARNASNPKMEKLQQVLLDHFAAVKQQTGNDAPIGKVIIFTNFRESVGAIVLALEKHKGMISAKMFIGQGSGSKQDAAGMKQKEQKAVLEEFRRGDFNTLVATCIAEEGLDIPQVDLIICFDAASSPGRNVQRMGRTGRHKQGRVVYILSAGREEEVYKRNQETTKRIHTQLRQPHKHFDLHQDNPRMLPRIYNPKRLDVDCGSKSPEKGVEGAEDYKGRGRGRGSRKSVRGSSRAATGRGRGPGSDKGGGSLDVPLADAAAAAEGTTLLTSWAPQTTVTRKVTPNSLWQCLQHAHKGLSGGSRLSNMGSAMTAHNTAPAKVSSGRAGSQGQKDIEADEGPVNVVKGPARGAVTICLDDDHNEGDRNAELQQHMLPDNHQVVTLADGRAMPCMHQNSLGRENAAHQEPVATTVGSLDVPTDGAVAMPVYASRLYNRDSLTDAGAKATTGCKAMETDICSIAMMHSTNLNEFAGCVHDRSHPAGLAATAAADPCKPATKASAASATAAATATCSHDKNAFWPVDDDNDEFLPEDIYLDLVPERQAEPRHKNNWQSCELDAQGAAAPRCVAVQVQQQTPAAQDPFTLVCKQLLADNTTAQGRDTAAHGLGGVIQAHGAAFSDASTTVGETFSCFFPEVASYVRVCGDHELQLLPPPALPSPLRPEADVQHAQATDALATWLRHQGLGFLAPPLPSTLPGTCKTSTAGALHSSDALPSAATMSHVPPLVAAHDHMERKLTTAEGKEPMTAVAGNDQQFALDCGVATAQLATAECGARSKRSAAGEAACGKGRRRKQPNAKGKRALQAAGQQLVALHETVCMMEHKEAAQRAIQAVTAVPQPDATSAAMQDNTVCNTASVARSLPHNSQSPADCAVAPANAVRDVKQTLEPAACDALAAADVACCSQDNLQQGALADAIVLAASPQQPFLSQQPTSTGHARQACGSVPACALQSPSGFGSDEAGDHKSQQKDAVAKQDLSGKHSVEHAVEELIPADPVGDVPTQGIQHSELGALDNCCLSSWQCHDSHASAIQQPDNPQTNQSRWCSQVATVCGSPILPQCTARDRAVIMPQQHLSGSLVRLATLQDTVNAAGDDCNPAPVCVAVVGQPDSSGSPPPRDSAVAGDVAAEPLPCKQMLNLSDSIGSPPSWHTGTSGLTADLCASTGGGCQKAACNEVQGRVEAAEAREVTNLAVPAGNDEAQGRAGDDEAQEPGGSSHTPRAAAQDIDSQMPKLCSQHCDVHHRQVTPYTHGTQVGHRGRKRGRLALALLETPQPALGQGIDLSAAQEGGLLAEPQPRAAAAAENRVDPLIDRDAPASTEPPVQTPADDARQERGKRRRLRHMKGNDNPMILPTPAAVSGRGHQIVLNRKCKRRSRVDQRAAIFFEAEAGHSDDQVSSDEHEGDAANDDFESSFINDDTPQSVAVQPRPVGMEIYHRSLLSPLDRPFGISAHAKRLQLRAANPPSVLDTPGAVRQEPSPLQYEDSFVVDSDDDDASGSVNETIPEVECEDSHDDACAVCGLEDGQLMLCDGCPVAVHLACVGLKQLPEGDWYCSICQH